METLRTGQSFKIGSKQKQKCGEDSQEKQSQVTLLNTVKVAHDCMPAGITQ